MQNYTLTYSESVNGWPSFYSYYPEWIIGMNQYLYSFNGGRLWRHNVNDNRNSYYGDTSVGSTMKSVINDMPLQNKLFKTINLESDLAWDTILETDIQTTGFINAADYEQKEASWFAYVRNQGTTPANAGQEFPLRSVNGIGRSNTLDATTPSAVIVGFPQTTTIANVQPGTLGVGDALYFIDPIGGNIPANAAPVYAGVITAQNVDLNADPYVNTLVVDTTVVDATAPTNTDAYYMVVKNQVVESHGVLGHYCIFKITNNSTNPTELFAVESEVMKSYP